MRRFQRRRLSRAVLVAAILMAAMTVAGCDVMLDQTITFYRNEAWEADFVVGMPPEVAALSGALQGVEQQLEEYVRDVEILGIRSSLSVRRKGSDVEYLLNASGQGYDLLQQAPFLDTEVFVEIVDGRRLVHFSSDVPADLPSVRSTIRLVGGEIISSNGQEVGRGTVEWVNPRGRIEAVLTERNRFDPGVLPLVLITGAVAVVGGRVILRRRSRRCYTCGARMARDAEYCPNCGQFYA